MPWLKIVHDCTLPKPDEIKLSEADSGSKWQCPKEDCNQIWQLRRGDLFFGPSWDRVTGLEDVIPYHETKSASASAGNGPVKDCVCCD